jgi:hypothetical protein
MDNEHGNMMLFGEGEKNLIAQGLVWYYVNLGYGKFVEQFVTPKLNSELKVEFVAIKVSVLYQYPYLFRLQQVGGW